MKKRGDHVFARAKMLRCGGRPGVMCHPFFLLCACFFVVVFVPVFSPFSIFHRATLVSTTSFSDNRLHTRFFQIRCRMYR